jgi:hypothetical protein
MKLLRFVPSLNNKELMLIEPTPMKEHVPEWYRLGEHDIKDDKGESMAGMKTCAPFLDVMLTGYCLVTPFDIYVGANEDGSHNIRWNGPGEWEGFIAERPKELGSTIPRPAGHSPNGLVWSSKWGWKSPRGWSTIVCHPHNRYDLPFTTLSGTIDSDKFIANGNIPFFIKEGWVGIIPAGTPYAQIIPFKRTLWKKVADFGLFYTGVSQGEKVRKKSYKKFLWVKKVYN